MLHLGQQWQELLLKDFKSYLHVHGMYSRGSLISTRKFKERDLKIAREMAKLTLVNFEGSPYSKFLLQQDSKGEKSTEHVSLVRFECQSSASKSRDLHFVISGWPGSTRIEMIESTKFSKALHLLQVIIFLFCLVLVSFDYFCWGKGGSTSPDSSFAKKLLCRQCCCCFFILSNLDSSARSSLWHGSAMILSSAPGHSLHQRTSRVEVGICTSKKGNEIRWVWRWLDEVVCHAS